MRNPSPADKKSIAPPSAGVLAVFLISLLLLVARSPARITQGFLWAEDAAQFLKQSYEIGIGSFWISYAGYFHLVPRTLAYLQTKCFALTFAPYFLCWSCLVISALCSTFLYWKIYNWLPSMTGRNVIAALFGLSLFLVPHGGEVFLNITNLQWIFGPCLLVLLIDTFQPEAMQEAWPLTLGRSLLLAIFSLTGPVAAIFLPLLAGLLLLRYRDLLRLNIILPAVVILVCSGIQLISMSSAPSEKTKGTYDYVAQLTQIWLGQLILPSDALAFIVSLWTPLLWILFVLVAALIPLSKGHRWTVAGLLVLSLGFFCLGVLRVHDAGIPLGPFGLGQRYFYLPAIFLFWAILIACLTAPWRFKAIPVILGATMLLNSGLSFTSALPTKWTIQLVEPQHYHLTFPPEWNTDIDTKAFPQSEANH